MCLHFYNTIGDYMEDEDDNLLIEYFKQYTNLLNDYGHILSVHLDQKHPQTQLQQNYLIINKQINKYLKCNDISQCDHYKQNRNRTTQTTSTNPDTNEPKHNHRMLYYVHMLDAIHTFFAHSIHIGHRVDLNEIKANKNMDYVDYILDKRSRLKALNYTPIIHTNNAYISPNEHPLKFGYRYHVSQSYKDNEQPDEYNPGYTYNQWFIPSKYANLKEEVLTNTIGTITVDAYDAVLFKATQYLNN
eukprot:291831_1